MKNINLGIANFIVLNKLKNSYFTNNLIEESKKLTSDFLDVVQNSPILQLEFKVYNNIENKHIDNDLIATRYIDSNIKLFEVYTNSEITKEHNKLNVFFTEDIDLNSDKIKLYESIAALVEESLNYNTNVNIDRIDESYTLILNHIKSPKKQLIENTEYDQVDARIIEIAIDKFNEKYETINEDDRILIKKLIKSNDTEKLELLEEYKNYSLNILNAANVDNAQERIGKTIQKINEMVYKPNTLEFSRRIDDDIISLHELKKGLI
jgi:hypothetical protein